MSEVLYFLLIAGFFYVMMRWGCGAHMMGGGHGGHNSGQSGHEPKRLIHDPVCGMELDAQTAKFTKPYRSGLYYFCSARCQQTFEKDPEKYSRAVETQDRR